MEQRPFKRTECSAQAFERRGLVVVPSHIRESCGESRECVGVQRSVRGDALTRTRAKLFDCPEGIGDADDGDVQVPAASHRVQSGKDFLVREIAGGPEQDQGVRLRRGQHVRYPSS